VEVIYEITFVLLRTIRLLGIKTCGLTEELGGWLQIEPGHALEVILNFFKQSFHVGNCIRWITQLIRRYLNLVDASAARLLKAISQYHAVPLPRHAVPPMLCRVGLRLRLSHLIYTVRLYLINTCYAAPVPCHDHAVLNVTSPSHGTARHGHGMACVK
jgi:hypothetical protein